MMATYNFGSVYKYRGENVRTRYQLLYIFIVFKPPSPQKNVQNTKNVQNLLGSYR